VEYFGNLENPKEYALASERSLKAVEKAEAVDNRRYREFLKWLKLESS
jgi:hypothetical protein